MAEHRAQSSPLVLTVGHSNRSLEILIEMLGAHEVELLIDVRTIPRSRHNPQFNGESLPDALRVVGIAYEHRKGLGGLRHPRKDSLNTGWRNEGFRGFADYMQSPAFATEVADLMATARKSRVALMCAEAVPWRCHRSLIADALAVRGVAVEHIMTKEKRQPHKLTPFAHIEGDRITYPAEQIALPIADDG
jgi:uncharacterized protein (DUF488 family)